MSTGGGGADGAVCAYQPTYLPVPYRRLLRSRCGGGKSNKTSMPRSTTRTGAVKRAKRGLQTNAVGVPWEGGGGRIGVIGPGAG